MMNIVKTDFMLEFGRLTDQLYANGWHERNSGNISVLMDEEDLKKYIDVNKVQRTLDLEMKVDSLKGKYFLVTGSGKYLKNVSRDIELNTGIVRISENGKQAEVIWGFSDGGNPTSELSTHLLSHEARLKVDKTHKVVIHTHATNIMAMTFVHELEDKAFTRTLWKMCTESIIVFPDGVGVLPWMVCGNSIIGVATAEKMLEHKLVVWSMHGIFATGSSLDDTFGLIETVEKSAQIYLMIKNQDPINTITDEELKQLTKSFNVVYKKGYLD